ncbi:hypothetical protein K439DRAFT_1662969 [Ramaria rubella]|nr:hypothetical protein K439DRAFT_1662969 [Ramaria rubella]
MSGTLTFPESYERIKPYHLTTFHSPTFSHVDPRWLSTLSTKSSSWVRNVPHEALLAEIRRKGEARKAAAASSKVVRQVSASRDSGRGEPRTPMLPGRKRHPSVQTPESHTGISVCDSSPLTSLSSGTISSGLSSPAPTTSDDFQHSPPVQGNSPEGQVSSKIMQSSKINDGSQTGTSACDSSPLISLSSGTISSGLSPPPQTTSDDFQHSPPVQGNSPEGQVSSKVMQSSKINDDFSPSPPRRKRSRAALFPSSQENSLRDEHQIPGPSLKSKSRPLIVSGGSQARKRKRKEDTDSDVPTRTSKRKRTPTARAQAGSPSLAKIIGGT